MGGGNLSEVMKQDLPELLELVRKKKLLERQAVAKLRRNGDRGETLATSLDDAVLKLLDVSKKWATQTQLSQL